MAASRSGRSMAATSAVAWPDAPAVAPSRAGGRRVGGRGGGAGLVGLDPYGQRFPAGERRHERGLPGHGGRLVREQEVAGGPLDALGRGGVGRQADGVRPAPLQQVPRLEPGQLGMGERLLDQPVQLGQPLPPPDGLVGFQGQAQQVERTRPFGRVEVAGQPQDRRLVEGVEATGGGPQQVAVGDEHRDLLLGRGAQVQPSHDPAGDGHLVGPIPQRLDQEPGQQQPLRMVEPGEVGGEVGGESGPGGLSEPFHQGQVMGGRRVHLEGVGLAGPQRVGQLGQHVLEHAGGVEEAPRAGVAVAEDGEEGGRRPGLPAQLVVAEGAEPLHQLRGGPRVGHEERRLQRQRQAEPAGRPGGQDDLGREAGGADLQVAAGWLRLDGAGRRRSRRAAYRRVAPLQQRRGDERRHQHDQQERGVEVVAEDAVGQPDRGEDQPDLAAGEHAQADESLVAAGADGAEGRHQLAHDGDGQEDRLRRAARRR